jgi:hypothetical protein
LNYQRDIIDLRVQLSVRNPTLRGDYMATIYDDSIAARGLATAAPSVAVVPGGGGLADGGLLSTVLLLSALGGNGLGGNHKDCVDQASINGLLAALNNNSVLGKLGSIEAAIPYNEAQVQLALAGQMASITQQNTDNTQHLGTQLGQIQLGQLVQSNAIQNAIAGVDTNVDRSTTTVTNAINASENRLANLFTENVIQGLRDDKVILSNQLAEERAERNRDRDRSVLEITMIQNSQQVSLQNQENKFEFERMRNLIYDTVQSIRATNQAINIGAGTLTSTPTNTNTNVKA